MNAICAAHRFFASVSGLDYALKGLADRMDPERDVLFPG